VGNSDAVLLQIYFSICVSKIIKMQCSLTKLLQQEVKVIWQKWGA